MKKGTKKERKFYEASNQENKEATIIQNKGLDVENISSLSLFKNEKNNYDLWIPSPVSMYCTGENTMLI